jgi:type I restriction enzyme S subunit
MGAFKRLDNYEKAVVTTLYICFRLRPGTDSDFILHFFEGGRIVKGLMQIAQEGGRAHGLLNIGLEDFFNLKLTIPPLPEQQAIARILQAADAEVAAQAARLSVLREQKRGLMQGLLTGRKRLQPNHDSHV